MEEAPKSIQDYVDFIKRRKWHILIPLGSISTIFVITALVLPPIYRSTSTILIEQQQIPTDFVKSTVTGYVDERLQAITQQMMSRTKLLEIINQFNLYADLRDKLTTEEIIEEMREDIALETISSEVVGETGRPITATIAFTLSYEGKDPTIVQRVANVLASLYLEENLKNREERAKTTSTFLEDELERLSTTMGDLEKKIAAFKEKHIGELPELLQLNLQTEQQLRTQIDEIDRQIRTMEDRKIYLQGQLATLEPDSPLVDRSGKRILDPKERLKILRTEYISLSANLSEKHPDVIKVKKEIADLEKAIETEDGLKDMKKDLEYKKTELETLETQYSNKHPDVIKLKKEIALLEEEVQARTDNDAAIPKEVSTNPENPAYINLMTQITSANMEIESLKKQTVKLNEKWHEYLKRLENTPEVERQYSSLARDYENARLKYRETMDKFMEAKRAEELEEARGGEKFTIIDPAQFPEKPHKPNRLAIMVIGLILSMGTGIGLSSVVEYSDHSIRNPDTLAKITGAPVLATIPRIVTEEEERKERKKRFLILVGSGATFLLAIIILHLFVIDLDLLWLKITKRLGITMF
jgi:succinoglycan biosynthesis transport protein ExoP